mgnify:CR=1 FL=1
MYLGWDIGIKNLAFCLMDHENGKFKIIDWGVINLLDEHSSKKMCNYMKDQNDPNSICGKSATYQNDTRENFYCKIHAKKLSEEDRNALEIIPDKVQCKYCKKKATRYCPNEDIHYCISHLKENNKTIEETDAVSHGPAIRTPLYTLGKVIFRKLDQYPSILTAKYICLENQPARKNPTMKSVQMMLYTYFISKVANDTMKVKDLVMMSAKNKLKVYNDEYGPVDPDILAIKDRYQRNKKQAVFTTEVFLKNEFQDWWDFYIKENKNKKDDLADSFLMCRYYITRTKKIKNI